MNTPRKIITALLNIYVGSRSFSTYFKFMYRYSIHSDNFFFFYKRLPKLFLKVFQWQKSLENFKLKPSLVISLRFVETKRFWRIGQNFSVKSLWDFITRGDYCKKNSDLYMFYFLSDFCRTDSNIVKKKCKILIANKLLVGLNIKFYIKQSWLKCKHV